MTDADKPKKNQNQGKKKQQAGPTERLDKAVKNLGRKKDGTLVDISAGTGEHPRPPQQDASVSSEIKKQKGAGGSQTPDVEPAATMYDPTQRGSVTGGSQDATMYEPTGTDQHRRPSSQQMQTPSGSGRPVAPFGGKIMVGTRVGQIEITGVLGKGGMGEVFKGYHQALDIDVALKVLPDELSRNELVRQRFLREARLCVKLDHPHIVRVYNVDEYAGNLYLVMEMIEGTDAAGMLKDGGRFRYKRALEIGAASADALSYAHTQGLVHRDVKPHNILLGARDGKIKLSDFGLARAATSSSHLTMSGQIMGTPHYMSPEQAESKEVTDKSDVYSLGVTLYHMLTGETPFVGDTPISVAVQHIAKEIIFPEIRFKPFPKELVAVLKRMAAKDPAKRCSAKQASAWLRKLISMATDEDIKVEDEQAMKSMAPVVRESQAFEQAQRERAQRDNQARVDAQTMLATVQEQSGRRPAVTHEKSESQTSSQPSVQVSVSGSGGTWAVVLLVLLLLGGGGAAGWYFTIGPGKDDSGGNDRDPIVADDDNDRDQDVNGPGDPDDPEDNGNNGTPRNPDGDDGPGDDNDPEGIKDDETMASRLVAAHEGISRATNLEEIKKAEKSLELATLEKERASPAQLDRLEELQENWERQFAYFEVEDVSSALPTVLESFHQARGENRDSAIELINQAVGLRVRLDRLKIPPEAAGIVEERRQSVIGRVNDAVADFWDELGTEADRLAQEEEYTEAESILEDMKSIRAESEQLNAIEDELARVQTLGEHKTIRARLHTGQYNPAKDRLNKLNERGVPESLKDAHRQVEQEVKETFETVFRGYISDADAAIAEDDFDAARDHIARANALNLASEHAAEAADLLHTVDILELIHDADVAVNGLDFTAARESLDGAKTRIENPEEGRKIPQDLPDNLAAAEDRFETALENYFQELMDNAKSQMDERDFSGAAESLQRAAELPLNPNQKARRKEFNTANRSALAEYVGQLIAKLEKALDDDDFSAAQEALDSIKSLSPPDEQVEKLEALEDRFRNDANSRHDELVAAAQSALEERNYKSARKALDDAALVPVDGQRVADAEAVDDRFWEMLRADFNRHLENADDHLANENFSEAAQEVKAAQKLLPGSGDEDLAREAKVKLESVSNALVATFDGLLQSAKNARQAELITNSDELLDDAEALLDESEDVPADMQELRRRLSEARDDHERDEDAYIESLFEKLEECVRTGAEEEGRRIVGKILALKPSPTVMRDARNLEDALTGETKEQRRAKLPNRLRTYFDARNLSVEQYKDIGKEITAVATSMNGEFGAVGTVNGDVLFYKLKRGTDFGSSTGGREAITAIAFAPDGSKAVSGNEDGTLVRYDFVDSSVSASNFGTADADVMGITFSPDGKILYVATYYGQLMRYNAETGASLGTMRSGLDQAECLAVSPDGNRLAIGGDEGRVALINTNSMLLEKTLKAPDDELIQSVSFNADSTQVIGGSIANQVCRWGFNDSEPRRVYEGLDEWVRGAGFSEDGRRCAAFDTEYRLKIWHTENGMEVMDFPYEKLKGDKEFYVTAGSIGSDGTILIGTEAGELYHLHLRDAG